jgi:rubrerythrin
MANKNEEVLKGLKTAMEAELTGHTFYKHAAETISDPMGRKTFAAMAAEEMEHFNYLRHQYESVLEKGGYDFTKKLRKKDVTHVNSPIFSDDLKDRIKDAHFEVNALTIGTKLELDAIRFYGECAKNAEDEDARTFYNQLVEWERDHYEALNRQLEALKEEYFLANNFVPM